MMMTLSYPTSPYLTIFAIADPNRQSVGVLVHAHTTCTPHCGDVDDYSVRHAIFHALYMHNILFKL